MLRPRHSDKHIEAATRWLVKAYDTVEEARALVPSGQTRLGAYSRLYYATHHIAKALLHLVGVVANRHDTIRRKFGHEWVVNRKFPKKYGRLLNDAYAEREKADYGEYLPTIQEHVEERLATVEAFYRRASREIPKISIGKILSLLRDNNPGIRDFSFDVYCPRSYHHHTRFTIWTPKGRASDRWIRTVLTSTKATLRRLRIKEVEDYVIGLNSKVNQYQEKHILMLDFDNLSTVPYTRFKGEPGFFFRTREGFHFIGARLLPRRDWERKMRKFSAIASKAHYELSMKRGYATIRISTSPRKPYPPVYIGRTN